MKTMKNVSSRHAVVLCLCIYFQPFFDTRYFNWKPFSKLDSLVPFHFHLIMFGMGVTSKMMISSFILILVGNNFVQGKRQLLEC